MFAGEMAKGVKDEREKGNIATKLTVMGVLKFSILHLNLKIPLSLVANVPSITVLVPFLIKYFPFFDYKIQFGSYVF